MSLRNVYLPLTILFLFMQLDVAAQAPELPPQWFQQRMPDQFNNTLSFCIDTREPGHLADQRIAEALAEALLLELTLFDVARSVVVEDNFEMLYVDLIDHCTAYLGFKLYPETYPDWLTFTSAFYEARFVVLARDNEVSGLEDLPAGTPIGSVQGTEGDIRFLTYNNSKPAASRWRRLPLGNPPLALNALANGTVEALVIWAPWWHKLSMQNPAFADFQVISAPVVSLPWIEVGAALTDDRGYQRTLLDDALKALHADGTIEKILLDLEFPGRSTIRR
jgi:polar amino acid transport system substrate-binding protein